MADNTNNCPNVALARVQVAGAVFQDTAGVLAFPQSKDMFNVTGDCTVNQQVPNTDSREKSPSLDVHNVFQGIASAADVSLNLYLRTCGLGIMPTGSALLRALQAMTAETMTGTVAEAFNEAATTIKIKVASGKVTYRGVIAILDDANALQEHIHYRTATQDPTDKTLWTLTDLTRGYARTTPTSAIPDDAVKMASVAFVQNICRPEFSLWVQTDHILQAVEGCVVTAGTIPISTSDAVELQTTITGRRVYVAGPSDLAQDATIASTKLVVDNAKSFFAGQKVQNKTKKDDNAGAGYLVTTVDESTNTLTITPALSMAWAVDDVVTWWMPEGQTVGNEIENRDTTIRLDGVPAKMRPGSISLQTPRTFTEEVGDRFPGQGIDDTRTSTVDLNVFMRKDAAIRMHEGFDGKEIRVDVEAGLEDGHRIAVVLRRVKMTAVTLAFETPTVVLNTSGRILGVKSEDSVEIILE